MATRRSFLAGVGAVAAGVVPRLGWASVGDPALIAAGKTGKESYVLHGLDAAGESLFQIPLPARGHAACAHPTRAEAVGFARRPGTFALVIDCGTGRVAHHLTPPEGSQFNGHGAYSADGSVLMTSEVVAETSEGRVGLWEADGYRRIGEWATGGIGPHDMKRFADGRLAVANGGIATDPTDRTKLNIGQMRPNLTLLDAAGAISEVMELDAELWPNSIRHLALAADGTLAFAMQWEGDPAADVPLLGLWRPGASPRLCEARPEEAGLMKGYAGSVAFSGDEGRVAITSPKGGAVMIFDAAGAPVVTHRRADLCGLTPALGAGFTATDGQGAVWSCADAGLELAARHATQWDNHLIRIG
ncbi:MAG TPA: DUF1513 domain-containing protein [Paracoccaceae bacterium]|nr:DUF1513 domain-containing protein [Paracoccaceae bacterium]